MPISSTDLQIAGKTSLDDFLRNQVVDQIAVDVPLFKKLMSKRKPFLGAKQNIVAQIRKSHDSNFAWAYGETPVSFNKRNTVEQAAFPWRRCVDGFYIAHDTLFSNGITVREGDRGAFKLETNERVQLTHLLNEQMDAFRIGFTEKLSLELHRDGTASDDAAVVAASSADNAAASAANAAVAASATTATQKAGEATDSATSAAQSAQDAYSYAQQAATGQVNADWNATSGKAQILNKPTLATVATSGSYNDLTNKPTIPAAVTVDSALSSSSTNPVQNKVINTALSAKANLASLATVATSGKYGDLTGTPTKVSAFTNDSGVLVQITSDS